LAQEYGRKSRTKNVGEIYHRSYSNNVGPFRETAVENQMHHKKLDYGKEEVNWNKVLSGPNFAHFCGQ
jgi:hypothetical protein